MDEWWLDEKITIYQTLYLLGKPFEQQKVIDMAENTLIIYKMPSSHALSNSFFYGGTFCSFETHRRNCTRHWGIEPCRAGYMDNQNRQSLRPSCTRSLHCRLSAWYLGTDCGCKADRNCWKQAPGGRRPSLGYDPGRQRSRWGLGRLGSSHGRCFPGIVRRW